MLGRAVALLLQSRKTQVHKLTGHSLAKSFSEPSSAGDLACSPSLSVSHAVLCITAGCGRQVSQWKQFLAGSRRACFDSVLLVVY